MTRPYWFLSTRAHSVGGPVGPVKVLRSDRPGYPGDQTGELVEAIRGRDVCFAVHGFNVDQENGMNNLSFWMDNLELGNAVPIGILWPGDCIVPIFLDYVVEGHEAIRSGKELAKFVNKQMSVAASISFASHSLGARVVLQTISGLAPGTRVRCAVLMAGALDDTCLTNEYKNAAGKIGEISLLSSMKDDVLSMAYPAGNFLQGIIDRGHPYWHSALGRDGPAQPYPPAPQLQPGWMIPESLNYGHLDYIPGAAIDGAYKPPVEIPPDGEQCPADTPGGLTGPDAKWKPGWSAGFVSTRYQRS